MKARFGFGALLSLVCGSVVSLALSVSAIASESEPYLQFQQQWAQAQYQQQGDAQEQALATLAAAVRASSAAHPDDLALKTWAGIIIGSYAGAKGGLGALSLAEESKAAYEAVIAKDPSVLHGSALTSLGVLYYKVPGWPLGFGDEDRAEFMLKRGLALNPDGIDSNYFYADFLFSQGKKEEAKLYLQKAKAAAPRPGREIADAGRQGEIARLQEQLKQ